MGMTRKSILTLTLLLIGSATICLGIVSAKLIFASVEYFRHAAALHSDLGFKHESPTLQLGGRIEEVFTLERIRPGSVLDRAGVRNGDIVIDMDITEFYRRLQAARGSRMSFKVVRGGDGPPLAQRYPRSITVHVPPQVKGWHRRPVPHSIEKP